MKTKNHKDALCPCGADKHSAAQLKNNMNTTELLDLLKRTQQYIEDVQKDFALEDNGINAELKQAIEKEVA